MKDSTYTALAFACLLALGVCFHQAYQLDRLDEANDRIIASLRAENATLQKNNERLLEINQDLEETIDRQIVFLRSINKQMEAVTK